MKFIFDLVAGNQLDATLTQAKEPHWWCASTAAKFRIWFDVLDFLPWPLNFAQSCLWANLGLRFDAAGYHSPVGVEITVPPGLNATACLDGASCQVPVWKGVIDKLVANYSYVAGVDIVTANYDWRLGPEAMNSTFAATAAIIESTVRRTGQRVAVASLSLGSPHAALFLASKSAAWRNKFVHRFISLSGAFGGSLWATMSQISPNVTLYANTSVLPTDLHAAIVGWGSLAWMTPNMDMLGDTVQVVTPTRNYTTSQFAQLFTDAGVPNGALLINTTTAPPFRAFLSPQLSLLGLNITCVFGTNRPSPSMLHYGASFDSPSKVSVAPGDGTLVDAALSAPCVAWNATRARRRHGPQRRDGQSNRDHRLAHWPLFVKCLTVAASVHLVCIVAANACSHASSRIVTDRAGRSSSASPIKI